MSNAPQIVFLASVLALGAPLALAQDDQPVRRRDPVREPIIDLEKQAEQRRPGQVMPGDGQPDYVPPDTTPAPQTAPETPPDVAVEPARPAVQPPQPQAPQMQPEPEPILWVTTPIAVSVDSVSAAGRLAQWRPIEQDETVGLWEGPAAGGRVETGAEVRTGLGAEVTLDVGGWRVTVDRLTKAAILGAQNQEDGSRRVEIHLERGQVMALAKPGSRTPLVVITPDQVVPVEAGVAGVSHDAFRGTRLR